MNRVKQKSIIHSTEQMEKIHEKQCSECSEATYKEVKRERKLAIFTCKKGGHVEEFTIDFELEKKDIRKILAELRKHIRNRPILKVPPYSSQGRAQIMCYEGGTRFFMNKLESYAKFTPAKPKWILEGTCFRCGGKTIVEITNRKLRYKYWCDPCEIEHEKIIQSRFKN